MGFTIYFIALHIISMQFVGTYTERKIQSEKTSIIFVLINVTYTIFNTIDFKIE